MGIEDCKTFTCLSLIKAEKFCNFWLISFLNTQNNMKQVGSFHVFFLQKVYGKNPLFVRVTEPPTSIGILTEL